MLAILSDLHFCDRTAVENVAPDAFKIALHDLYGEAARAAKTLNRRVGLDLVLLGDVFDLLRTERWFEVPVGDRPWGSAGALLGEKPSPAVLAQAHAILTDVLDKNAAALAALSTLDAGAYPGVDVRRILLPGNHDRLALHDDLLYARMRAAIGAVDERTLAAEGIYPHRLELPAYGLLARHGHEWDPWNFESFEPGAKAHYDDASYLPAPIGDPITTELVAALPYEVKQRLAGIDVLSPEEKDVIYTRLQRIEDVRPLFAALQWIYQESGRMAVAYGREKADALRVAIDDAVRTLARRFLDLDFYRAWHEKHGGIRHPFSKANELRAALEALTVVSVESLGHVGFLLDKLSGAGDEDLAGAKHEDLARVGSKDLRFVVYGHTHQAEVVPLHSLGAAEDVYLNTGTFRQRVWRTEDKAGFVASEYMTYLYFFREDEAAAWRGPGSTVTGPAYTAWTGMRSR